MSVGVEWTVGERYAVFCGGTFQTAHPPFEALFPIRPHERVRRIFAFEQWRVLHAQHGEHHPRAHGGFSGLAYLDDKSREGRVVALCRGVNEARQARREGRGLQRRAKSGGDYAAAQGDALLALANVSCVAIGPLSSAARSFV